MSKKEEDNMERIATALEQIADNSKEIVSALDAIYGRLDEIRMEIYSLSQRVQ